MNNTIVPLISSSVVGPLGVLHLPRIWLKTSLDCLGKLAPGYADMCAGLDQMVLGRINLAAVAVIRYINSERPTYTQFESWVAKQPGVKLDRDTIDDLNETILNYNHDDDTRKSIFEACGLSDETCSFRDAIRLNQLANWAEFHKAELKESSIGPSAPDSD